MNQIKRKNIKWWVGIGSCMVLFGAIGAFAYFKMNFLINGVQIQASISRQNSNSPVVIIHGVAENAVYVAINGREIYIDEHGNFAEAAALLPGLGVVTIDAQDKFGKSSEKKFEIMYTDSTGSFAYNEEKNLRNN